MPGIAFFVFRFESYPGRIPFEGAAKVCFKLLIIFDVSDTDDPM